MHAVKGNTHARMSICKAQNRARRSAHDIGQLWNLTPASSHTRTRTRNIYMTYTPAAHSALAFSLETAFDHHSVCAPLLLDNARLCSQPQPHAARAASVVFARVVSVFFARRRCEEHWDNKELVCMEGGQGEVLQALGEVGAVWGVACVCLGVDVCVLVCCEAVCVCA